MHVQPQQAREEVAGFDAVLKEILRKKKIAGVLQTESRNGSKSVAYVVRQKRVD
jgi:hypothetical protein